MLTRGARPPWPAHPLRQAAELLRTRYPDDGELLATLVSLPAEACRYGQTGEALASADELYRLTVARYGSDNLFVDTARLLRGQLLLTRERAADAVALLQQAHEGYRRHVGEKNQNTLLAQLELAEAFWLVGRADESQRAFAAVEQAMARDHADDQWVERMVMKTRQNLAKLHAGETLHRCGP